MARRRTWMQGSPNDIKFSIHYLLIVHGREWPVCRENGKAKAKCEYREKLKGHVVEEE